MDKKLKFKTELAKKLKKETSVTGTGASVTPGTGEGVATKYAFGKRDNKGTPSDWKSAPSIPNRPSKAMDYKQLWEIKRDQEVKITSGIHAGNTAVVHDFDSEKDSASGDDWVDVLIGSKKEKKTVKASELKPLKEGYEHLRYLVSDLKNLYYSSNDDAFKKAVVDAIPDGSQYQYILAAPEKHIQKLEALKQMLPQAKVSDVKGAMNIIDNTIEFFRNKETLQEGYAKFRNETKMRSKPDQFHQAVKQVKQKMNEINRIFEYVDRLKSELSEGEDLKYKKYTENAFQQIKESAKALFLKSTKLK